MKFVSPTCRQTAHQAMGAELLEDVLALKNQELGLQLSLSFDCKSWVNLNEDTSLPWSGLIERFRIRLVADGLDARISFEGDVEDDDGQKKKDRILHQSAGFLPKGEHFFWIDVKGATAGKYLLTAQLLQRKGYEEEELVDSCFLLVEIAEFDLDDLKDKSQQESFFLDLWQHPSSLARYYQLDLWSDEHFRLIETFMEALAEAGQKVCDLIISDYSWAGQDCYHVMDNPSSLFEYNIVGLSRQAGQLQLDFKAMDRYLSLCERLGMAEEINLFGILGNWDGRSFGKPIEDYLDPIRLQVYDLDKGHYNFIRTKAELKEYLRQVFAHLQELGLWDRVKVIADEPNNPEIFATFEAFLTSCSDQAIVFKHACLHGEFLENYEGNFDSNSVISSVLIERMGQEDSAIFKHRKEMTWYNCCFPQNLNVFIRSHLMESYLIGYFTYAFEVKGFLRWNYCLWTEDPNKDITYKSYKWAAGDMFFVYPARDGRPEFSLRFKNMKMGIEDWQLLKAVEAKKGRAYVLTLLKPLIGDADQMTYDEKEDRINFTYNEDYKAVTQLKRACLDILRR